MLKYYSSGIQLNTDHYSELLLSFHENQMTTQDLIAPIERIDHHHPPPLGGKVSVVRVSRYKMYHFPPNLASLSPLLNPVTPSSQSSAPLPFIYFRQFRLFLRPL